MRITSITLRKLSWPLINPYRLSYRTFEVFEPYLVEVGNDLGRNGFGDGHISPGSSSETREGGWTFLRELAPQLLGQDNDAAKTLVLARFADSKVAATAMVIAVEALEDSPRLKVDDATRLPLLTPVSSIDLNAIPVEVQYLLDNGFRTFKIKVGLDVDADLARVRAIQQAASGRARLRIDANRAFDREQGCRFAAALNPEGIELFEQPCAAEDWAANAAVAKISSVPLMLDEPICTLADIDRAAEIEGVGFCKLKLKRFGSLDRLYEGLEHVRSRGMAPVLGDGLGSELCSWMEACVARGTIDNAGEFNGYLKPKDRLFANPLGFDHGDMVMPAGYQPHIDHQALQRHTTDMLTFTV